MCGRMMLTHSAREIADAFALAAPPPIDARYNIAPSQPIPAVRVHEGGLRRLSFLHWGLVPSWAKDRAIGNRMINARSETVAEKPAFRAALRRRRCIVPATGFYEWPSAAGEGGKGKGKGKGPRIPHLFRDQDGGLLAIAGLYEEWVDRASGEVLESCTLLTTEANAVVRPVHHRMPVLLEPHDHADWLDPRQTEADAVLGLLVPASPDRLVALRVGTHVNDPRHEDPGCIEPAT